MWNLCSPSKYEWTLPNGDVMTVMHDAGSQKWMFEIPADYPRRTVLYSFSDLMAANSALRGTDGKFDTAEEAMHLAIHAFNVRYPDILLEAQDVQCLHHSVTVLAGTRRQDSFVAFFQDCAVKVIRVYLCGDHEEYLRETWMHLEMFDAAGASILPLNRRQAMAEYGEWTPVNHGDIPESVKTLIMSVYQVREVGHATEA